MTSTALIPKYTPEELRLIQEKGLRWTVQHAYSGSPQYRAKFVAAGLMPEDIQTLDDLQRLPLTTTEDLRDGYPYPLLSVPLEEVVRVHASSGTTGKRKVLAYTEKDVQTFYLQMARCYELAGITPADRVQIAVGYGLWTAGIGFQLGSEKVGALTIPIGPGNLEVHLQMLADFGTTCLCCTASMALLMAEEVERHGLHDAIQVKKIIFGGEPHSPKMRKAFEQKLGLQSSYDIGGMTEMYGPGSALECDLQQGLHYWADLFIIEILDPDTLLPVAEGEVGEMVVTSLCKEASPMIRYRTRDLCRLIPGTCACGCTMPRHDHILGRSDDMFIYRGVNIYPSQMSELLHDFSDVGVEYHIELSRKDGKDFMLLKVERAVDSTAAVDARLAAQICKAIHSKVLVSAVVEIVAPMSLPRAFGKSRRITDTRLE